MRLSWGDFLKAWSSIVNDNQKNKSLPTLPELVEQARQDWIFSKNYFNEVYDQDLIEYAIFLIKTNERKYMYLLKKAQQEGVTYLPNL